MHKKIKGIHRVKKPLANGVIRYNYYCWRGGPRFWHTDDRPAPAEMPQDMVDAYDAAIMELGISRKAARRATATMADLIVDYKDDGPFKAFAPKTRKESGTYFDMIRDEFGDDEVAVFEDRSMRGDVKAWHRTMAATPRKADIALSHLVKLLNFAVDEGQIAHHIAGKISRLDNPESRASILWQPDEIEALLKHAGRELRQAIYILQFFGLRRADLVGIAPTADKGTTLEATTSKSRHRTELILPIVPAARAVLDEIAADRSRRDINTTTLLYSSYGRPWTPDGFSTVFDRAKKAAGIDKRLHDFRGTAVTHYCRAGFTDEEIAEMVGWNTKDIRSIRRKYVDKATIISAAIARLERQK